MQQPKSKTGTPTSARIFSRFAAMALAMVVSLPLGVLFGGALATAQSLPAAAATSGASAGHKVFLGYWAKWGADTAPQASLDANRDRIDLYSPYWYTLRADGTLSSRESGHQALTNEVHAAGNKVIPLINKSSSDAPLLDAATRQRSVNNIYDMLVANGFDGVNIDFEGMDPSTRWGVTAFMKELAAKLSPAGLLVTIAVPAKWSPDDSINSFAAPFDYAALGSIVDYLVIMTYDQHAGWSGPGPVAGADWTDKVIRYATSVVPSEKILLGLAGYGYDWSTSGTATVDAADAPGKAASYGAEIAWDATAKVPHFTYWTSSGARHDVWYENSYSVEYKIDQVNRYDLGGVALWALGMEDARFWQVIRGTAGWSGGLGGTSSSTPAGGQTGGSGSSGGSGTGASGSGGGASGGASAAVGPVFSDVPPGYWAFDAIMRLWVYGIVGGVDQNIFQPERPVTRAEFAAMLARALDLPAPSGSAPVFSDVTATDWFAMAVAEVVASGHMTGESPGLFGPNLHLTRQEAAVIAARAGAELPARPDLAAASYKDSASLAAWAYTSVMEATRRGLISGYPDGTFRPGVELTRAEAAVLIGRLRP